VLLACGVEGLFFRLLSEGLAGLSQLIDCNNEAVRTRALGLDTEGEARRGS
jgi:hypothetical protein